MGKWLRVKMECDKVKKEFPNLEFVSCCLSCHEDADTGYGEDLWWTDTNDKERHVCCAIGEGISTATQSG